VSIPPGTARLRLAGRNLLAGGVAPTVRLDGRPLEPAAAEDDRLEVELPAGLRNGALEVDLGDGEAVRYDLRVEHDGDQHRSDPWGPRSAP
jgi:hypothetical protein